MGLSPRSSFLPPMLGRGINTSSRRIATRPFNIVALGNSLMGGMLPRLALLRPSDTISDQSYGNARTSEFITFFDQDVLPFLSGSLTNVLLVQESIDEMNDHAVTPSAELAQLKAVAALGRSHGMLVVSAGCIPADDPPADPNLVVQLADLITADHGWADAIAVGLPYDAAWVPAGSTSNPTYYQDGVHLKTLGYDVVAGYFNTALNTL